VKIPTPIAPKRQDWPRLLGDLARQIEDGRIYDRDLLALAGALNVVHEVFGRRWASGGANPPRRHGPNDGGDVPGDRGDGARCRRHPRGASEPGHLPPE
jgi:hypothetical protein